MSCPLFWFAGGRSLPAGPWRPWVVAALRRVAALGGGVAVGCAEGADRLAAECALEAGLPVLVACAWPRSRAPRWVLAAEGRGAVVRFGCGGPVAAGAAAVLRRRTAWVARAVAARPGSWLVLFPGGPGSALSARLAGSLGLPVWRVAVAAARLSAPAGGPPGRGALARPAPGWPMAAGVPA